MRNMYVLMNTGYFCGKDAFCSVHLLLMYNYAFPCFPHKDIMLKIVMQDYTRFFIGLLSRKEVSHLSSLDRDNLESDGMGPSLLTKIKIKFRSRVGYTFFLKESDP